MDYKLFLIFLLWGLLSISLFVGTAAYCKNLNKIEKTIVILIFILAGPIFAISNVLQELLNIILPEGWNNEDDFKGY